MSEFKRKLLTNVILFLIILLSIITRPYRILLNTWNSIYFKYFVSLENTQRHKSKVAAIRAQIQTWNKNGRKGGLLCTSKPSWRKFTLTDIDKSKLNQISVDLEEIVSIDKSKMVITVEPRLSMGTLTEILTPMGYSIPVVPELEELTVGGLICGAGLETSSHKYGYFYKQCLSFEVVLPNGKVTTCSKTENPDLFDAIPMSYGTLGFLTAVEIPLIKIKPFVKIQYYPETKVANAIQLLQDSTHEFVEGLQFSKNEFIVMYGDFVDSVPKGGKSQTFLKWTDPTFHKSAEEFLKMPPGSALYVPTRDYYHRHSKAYFWCFSGPHFNVVNSVFFRYTFGWIFPVDFKVFLYLNTLLSGKILDGAKTTVKYVLQDYLIPLNTLPELLNEVDKDLGLYPIWLCPCRVFSSRGMIRPKDNKETIYVDVGVYGVPPKPQTDITKIWTKYERFTYENNGLIGFYTYTHLTRDEFDIMFPPELYLKMREKYNCNGAFPLVYDKVSFDARIKNTSSGGGRITSKNANVTVGSKKQG